MPAPKLSVTNPVSGMREAWSIVHNLTDRWGEINEHDLPSKPQLDELEADPELLDSLRSQMYGEDTFVAYKDGAYGILFEIEFACAESDDSKELKPRNSVVNALISGLKHLAASFTNVAFAIPDSRYIYNNRPAVWAFVKSGTLSGRQLEALGTALTSL